MDTEGRWLTYGELAEIRRTKRASAVKLAMRERWPRQSGNDRGRTVRVLVPPEWLVSTRDTTPDTEDETGSDPVFTKALEAVEAAHAGEVRALRELLDTTTARLVDTEDRAKRAEAGRQEAAQALEDMRRADEARKARGRLRRVWDGWRGR